MAWDSFVDVRTLEEFWQSIVDAFSRKTQAIGSIIVSGTSLIASTVAGDTVSNLDLDNVFATNAEAAHDLYSSGFELFLMNVNNGQLSRVPLTQQAQTALNDYFARQLEYDSNTGQLKLKGNSGNQLDYVTIPDASKSWTNSNFISYVTIDGTPSNPIYTFRNGNGTAVFELQL